MRYSAIFLAAGIAATGLADQPELSSRISLAVEDSSFGNPRTAVKTFATSLKRSGDTPVVIYEGNYSTLERTETYVPAAHDPENGWDLSGESKMFARQVESPPSRAETSRLIAQGEIITTYSEAVQLVEETSSLKYVSLDGIASFRDETVTKLPEWPMNRSLDTEDAIASLTYQQAFRLLEEKYGLDMPNKDFSSEEEAYLCDCKDDVVWNPRPDATVRDLVSAIAIKANQGKAGAYAFQVRAFRNGTWVLLVM